MACHPLCILLSSPRVCFDVNLRLLARFEIQTKKISSLRKQIETGVEQKYKEHEIVDVVIRAIGPGLVLRRYLESFKDLSLDRLKKILRSHYGVKNTTELYQSLASICQNGKETPQAFLMQALDLRQKILFASQEGEIH